MIYKLSYYELTIALVAMVLLALLHKVHIRTDPDYLTGTPEGANYTRQITTVIFGPYAASYLTFQRVKLS